MQIICKDGTTIQCADFQATDSGVLFYRESRGRDEDDEDEELSADGFVPVTELRFVLPDEFLQRGMGAERGQPAQAPGGAAGAPGGTAQQQQFQGGQRRQPPGPGGQ